ncbi:MAG TPA: ATP-binding protein [Chloroflexota bacterium]
MQASNRQIDLFHLLVESVRDYAIFLLDPQGHIRSWNAGAQRIKGYTADEIIGKHFSIFYQPPEVRSGKPPYELQVAAEEGRYEEEGWRVRKDGSLFWASVTITALRAPDGELVGFAKVTRDLTERKRAEEERATLLDLERKARQTAEAALERIHTIQTVTDATLAYLTLDGLLAALFDRIADALAVDTAAVLLLDGDGTALVPHAARGLEEEVVAGIRIPLGQGFAGRITAERRPIVLDDVEHAEVMNPILHQKGVRSMMGVPLIVESRVLGVLHVGTLYPRHFTEGDVAFLQIVADRAALGIERARLYDAAQQARAAAEEAGSALRLRDEFLSVAAHELKTPVTSVRGLADWVLRAADRGKDLDPERQHRALVMIHRQTEHLSRLITQLLETTRLEAGHLYMDLQIADLTPLIHHVVEQAQAQSDEHAIVVSAPPTLRATVDPFRFEQVVTNLLANAIKYSPDGGQIDVELAEPRPGIVRLRVRDRGLGVPLEEQERIFERFYQAHLNSHRSGLGLGLHLSREIVARHGGRLWVETPPDGGSRFVAELPAAVPVGSAP